MLRYLTYLPVGFIVIRGMRRLIIVHYCVSLIVHGFHATTVD